MFHLTLLNDVSILAQTRVLDVGSAVDERLTVSNSIFAVGIFICCLVGIVVLVLMAKRMCQILLAPYNDPQQLYHSLCKLHGLSVQEQSELSNLAKERSISNISDLFIDPELWYTRSNVTADERSAPSPASDRLTDARRNLMQKLFESAA